MKKQVKQLKQKTVKKAPYMTVVAIFLAMSTFQLYGIVNSFMAQYIAQVNPVTASAEAEEKVMGEQAATRAENLIPQRISIPSAKINLPVVSVALKNGTWTVSDGVANYAVETSKISSKKGNVGIFAHDRENAFSRIKKVKKDDIITLQAQGYTATYKVLSMQIIDPTNVETFYTTANPTLTLITCDGIFSQQRFVVKASLVKIEKGIK